MTQPEVPVRDLMVRTMENLRTIDDLNRRGDRVYEVTQLVNSFLGALAHPWEHWEEALQRRTGRAERFMNWPDLPKDDYRDADLAHPGEVIQKLRNAIAHGNVEFLADQNNEIERIRLWNVTPDGYRDWGTTLSVAELRAVLDRFVEIASILPQSRPPEPRHVSTRPQRERCPRCGQYPRANRSRSGASGRPE